VSTQTVEPTIELQLAYPDGQLRLRAPSDIPLQELLAEFLEVCEQPDSDDWTLSADGTNPYPAERSLDELGVSDGAQLVLGPHPPTDRAAQPHFEDLLDDRGGGSGGSDRRATMELVPRETVGVHAKLTRRPGSRENRQPLADKTVRTLPKRLSGPARVTETLRLLGAPQDQSARPVSTDTPGPAHFTRRTRVSPVARLRAAWLDTEYRRPAGAQRLHRHGLDRDQALEQTVRGLDPPGRPGLKSTDESPRTDEHSMRRSTACGRAGARGRQEGRFGRRSFSDHVLSNVRLDMHQPVLFGVQQSSGTTF
jgi:WXG100 protein secretion system (Wss), protein YukD